jgi:adenylosuccinate synthase
MNVREFFLYARRMVGATGVGLGGAYAWRYVRRRQKRRLDHLSYEKETKRLSTLKE